MTVSAEYDISQDQLERMELMLSITMTVAEWRKVHDHLEAANSTAPSQLKWAVRSALDNVRAVAGKKFRFPQP